MLNTPVTAAKTSHALSIHMVMGKNRAQVGGITSISYNQSVILDEEYEVNRFATGLPKELVAQILNTRTLSIDRYELWHTPLMRLINPTATVSAPELLSLVQQVPFEIRTRWTEPNTNLGILLGDAVINSFLTSSNSKRNIYCFKGCKFTTLGQTLSAEGDRSVLMKGNITWKSLDFMTY